MRFYFHTYEISIPYYFFGGIILLIVVMFAALSNWRYYRSAMRELYGEGEILERFRQDQRRMT